MWSEGLDLPWQVSIWALEVLWVQTRALGCTGMLYPAGGPFTSWGSSDRVSREVHLAEQSRRSRAAARFIPVTSRPREPFGTVCRLIKQTLVCAAQGPSVFHSWR